MKRATIGVWLSLLLGASCVGAGMEARSGGLPSDQPCSFDAECGLGSCQFGTCSARPPASAPRTSCSSDAECVGGTCQSGTCSP